VVAILATRPKVDNNKGFSQDAIDERKSEFIAFYVHASKFMKKK
jgi:hypothetical protein